MTDVTGGDKELVFNARWLTPVQVAKTFVPPPYFERLATSSHTLLIGPRGSGKTTLLKMLQPKALAAWVADEASRVRGIVDYTGVFIPADISWREQVTSMSADLDPAIQVELSHAAFTTSALHALVESALWRVSPEGGSDNVGRKVVLSPDMQAQLVRAVADSWLIPNCIPSLLALKHKLRSRLMDLPLIAAELTTRHIADKSALAEHYQFLTLPLFESIGLFIEIFDDLASDPDAKWALLFDEMEIAPEWIQRTVFRATRSVNQKLLLKLALSPYNETLSVRSDGTSPSGLNDFDQIQLWYAHRDQDVQRGRQRKFCEALWHDVIVRRGFSPTNPYIALGQSYALLDDDGNWPREAAPRELGQISPSRAARSPYAKDGKWGRRFVQLAEKDATFRDYLAKHHLNPEELDGLSEQSRAQLIRKVTPVVVFREFYRRPERANGDGSPGGRSRKGSELFVGAETFFLLSEGHPRWLKVTLARMLEGLPIASSLRIPPTRQGAQVVSYAQRFAALLKTFPSVAPSGTSTPSVLAFIRKLASYFYEEVVLGPFDPEPYLSFIVDSNTPDHIIGLVETAVNLGALVYVPDDDGEILLKSVRGKRFRLSYWLAPLYRLPLNLGKAVALSTILGRKRAIESTNLALPFEFE